MRQGDKFQHYKGGVYTFLMFATDSETGQTIVVYQSDKTGEVYTRYFSDFNAELPSNEKRFRYIPKE